MTAQVRKNNGTGTQDHGYLIILYAGSKVRSILRILKKGAAAFLASSAPFKKPGKRKKHGSR